MQSPRVFVSDLETGRSVDEIFLLAEARQGQARNGPFWHMELADRSGRVPAKIFSPQSAACPELAPGMLVRVSGQVGVYRDQPQIVADAVTVVDLAQVDPADFVATAARPSEDMLADLEALCREHLRHKPWRALCRKVLTNAEVKARLMAAPGAVSIHHAYAGGLLEHTLAVCRLCMAFCDLYPDLDREVLLAGAVFHDLGKAWEYRSGLKRGHTDEGRLLGHIHITLDVLEPFLAKAEGLDPELVTHLKHIILSHHGELEFGSPKRPKTSEAFALHFADNLDAKLQTVHEALDENGDDEPGWSAFQRSLGRPVYRPRKTPGREAADCNHDEDRQCLLPLKA